MLRRLLLLPQAAAKRALFLRVLLPGRLLPQTFALRALLPVLLLPGRLLPQAAAMPVLSVVAAAVQLLRTRLRKVAPVHEIYFSAGFSDSLLEGSLPGWRPRG